MRYVILLLLWLSLHMDAQDHFKAACHAYDQKNYQKAYDLFSAVEPRSATVWYNMGNAAYYLGKETEALVCWSAAIHKGCGTVVHDGLYNKKYVLEKKNMPFSVQHVSLYKKCTCVPFLVWQLFAIFFLIFSFLFGFHILFTKKVMVYACFGATVGIFIIVHGIYHEIRTPHGVIIKSEVLLYTGPDEKFDVLTSISLGTDVTILAQQQGWYKVAVHGKVGWLVGTTVARYDDTPRKEYDDT